MDDCTQNYECLVIDNTSKSTNFEDVVYWYKAEERHFRLGHSKFWDLASRTKKRIDDDTDEKAGIKIEKLSGSNNF